MTVGGHQAPEEVEELRREERVPRERAETEGAAVVHPNGLEADVRELPSEHWLRQCAGQSGSERGRVLDDLFRERVVEYEVR